MIIIYNKLEKKTAAALICFRRNVIGIVDSPMLVLYLDRVWWLKHNNSWCINNKNTVIIKGKHQSNDTTIVTVSLSEKPFVWGYIYRRREQAINISLAVLEEEQKLNSTLTQNFRIFNLSTLASFNDTVHIHEGCDMLLWHSYVFLIYYYFWSVNELKDEVLTMSTDQEVCREIANNFN